MKKVSVIIISIIMVFSLVACTSKSNIVGTWEVDDDILKELTDETYVFTKDGSGSVKICDYNSNQIKKFNFTWKLDNDTVFCTFDDGSGVKELLFDPSKTKLTDKEDSSFIFKKIK